MIKENKFKAIVSSIVILLPILFGVISWEKLPEKIATHWGPDGNPDQYSSKLFAVLCLPLITFAIHWLCLFISKFDPKNKDQHKKNNRPCFLDLPRCINTLLCVHLLLRL